MQASYLRRAGFRGRYLVSGRRGVHHVMSRTAYGQFLFDDEAKEVFLRMLRKQAGFCGGILWLLGVEAAAAELQFDTVWQGLRKQGDGVEGGLASIIRKTPSYG